MIEADLLLIYCDSAFDIIIIYYLKMIHYIHFFRLIRNYMYISSQNVVIWMAD